MDNTNIFKYLTNIGFESYSRSSNMIILFFKNYKIMINPKGNLYTLSSIVNGDHYYIFNNDSDINKLKVYFKKYERCYKLKKILQ